MRIEDPQYGDSGQARHQNEFTPTAETMHLVEDLEALVNKNADTYLGKSPSEVAVYGLKVGNTKGEVPYVLNRIRREQLLQTGVSPELIDMDLQCIFPLKQRHADPFQLTYHWSNGRSTIVRAREASTVLLTLDADGSTIDAGALDDVDAHRIAAFFEVPEEVLGRSTPQLLDAVRSADSVHVCRKAHTVIDPMTSFTLVHDARIRNDEDNDRHINQELLLEINHFKERSAVQNPYEAYLPPINNYRTMLRFNRTENEDGWKFTGSYKGTLTDGELLGEVTYHSDIAVPSNKALDKALYALAHPAG